MMFQRKQHYANQPSRPWAPFVTRSDGTRVQNIAYLRRHPTTGHTPGNIILPGVKNMDALTNDDIEYETLLARARTLPSEGFLAERFAAHLDLGEYLTEHPDLDDTDPLVAIYHENSSVFDTLTLHDIHLDRERIAHALDHPSFITTSSATLANTLLKSRDRGIRFIGRLLGVFTTSVLAQRDKLRTENMVDTVGVTPEDLHYLLVHARLVKKYLDTLPQETLTPEDRVNMEHARTLADDTLIIDAEIVHETVDHS